MRVRSTQRSRRQRIKWRADLCSVNFEQQRREVAITWVVKATTAAASIVWEDFPIKGDRSESDAAWYHNRE